MSLNAINTTTDKIAAFVVICYYRRRTQGHTIHRAAAYDSTGQLVWDSGKGGRYGSTGTASSIVKDDLEAAGVDRAGAALFEHQAHTMKAFKEPFSWNVVKAAGHRPDRR